MRRLRTIALLGRIPGLHVLRDALIGNPRIQLIAVYTHGHRPKAEGGGERPELADFRRVCARENVPLRVLDFPEARTVERHFPEEPFDLLLSLSWRHILTPAALVRPRVAAINFHRGDLPTYAGAEPVRRAIEAGEKRIAITAHRMIEDVDAGEVLDTVWMDIEPMPNGMTSAAYAEDVKKCLIPLYAPLARKVIGKIQA
ncbi:MAG: hypothetical protein FJX42_05435 [Alphaproteobacteria bacterium]|nr:hypothetical protein [Alphaproteobacteria bacterium]